MFKTETKIAVLTKEDFEDGEIPEYYQDFGDIYNLLKAEVLGKTQDCGLVFIGNRCVKNRFGTIGKKGRARFV